jgi:rhamnogalacturonyl hydrolase YesR
MKKILSILIVFNFTGIIPAAVPFTRQEIKQDMRQVADWQIKHQKEVRHSPLDWTNATLYIGMAEWAKLAEEADKDESYYQWLIDIGNRYSWTADKRLYHADDLAVCQVFLELYRKYDDTMMYAPTFERINRIIDNPSNGSLIIDYSDQTTLDRWSWCDALFMAPPLFAKLYKITGKEKYMEFMDKEFKSSYVFLYDLKERMFFRDSRYFYEREANGEKVFWGRGNGWVLGGLVEILKELPEKDNYRPFYEKLFVEMCSRMVEIQQPDGLWHASLLDPVTYSAPETSASSFIVYALAYGVNEGILAGVDYFPAIEKSWSALKELIGTDGQLGYVQPVGADPKKVTKEMTDVYGVGAFLLAGSEMYRMAK